MTYSSATMGLFSSVAVDDAKSDDNGHAEERANRQHQPTVLELSRDDAAQEYRTRSVHLSSTCTSRTVSCRASAARRHDRCSLYGRDGAVNTTDLTR